MRCDREIPPGELGAPATRQAMHADLLRLIEQLDAEQLVTGIMPKIASEVVERALTDAETSSKLRVQRVPWIECIPLSMVTCRPFAIARALSYRREDTVVALLRKVQSDHPKLSDLGPRA